MKKEQIRNIDKNELEEILKENNISLSDKAFNNCKRDKEDVFRAIWSAYNYGFEITPQKSKATQQREFAQSLKDAAEQRYKTAIENVGGRYE